MCKHKFKFFGSLARARKCFSYIYVHINSKSKLKLLKDPFTFSDNKKSILNKDYIKILLFVDSELFKYYLCSCVLLAGIAEPIFYSKTNPHRFIKFTH